MLNLIVNPEAKFLEMWLKSVFTGQIIGRITVFKMALIFIGVMPCKDAKGNANSEFFNDRQVRANSADCSLFLYEPRREKTGFLHMRKQRRRSASG